MNKTAFKISLLTLLVFLSLSAETFTEGFLFTSLEQSAYLHSVNNADMFVQSADSVLNNFSSITYGYYSKEIKCNYFIDNFNNTMLNLFGIYKYNILIYGMNSQYLHSADEFITETPFKTLYSGLALSGFAAFNPFMGKEGEFPFTYSAGAGISFIRETVADTKSMTLVLHPSATIAFLNDTFFTGIYIRNLGISPKYLKLPVIAAIGAKYTAIALPIDILRKKVLLNAMGKYEIDMGSDHKISLGAEFDIHDMIFVRLGGLYSTYKARISYNKSLNTGVGVHYKNLTFDFSYMPRYNFQHQFLTTIGYRFFTEPLRSKDLLEHKRTYHKPEPLSTTAIINSAMFQLNNNNTVEAIKIIRNALAEDPKNSELKEIYMLLISKELDFSDSF